MDWKLVYKRNKQRIGYIAAAIGALLFIVGGVVHAMTPPSSFPDGSLVVIEKGEHLDEIAEKLQSNRIIRSGVLFRIVTVLKGGDRAVQAGDYYFAEPISTSEVSRRVIEGDYRIEPWEVTIPEGSTIYQMASLFRAQVPEFDSIEFLKHALPYRGYLFPDTYRITPSTTAEELVQTMRSNFRTRIAELEDKIAESDHSLHDIVVMASILEAEGLHMEDKRMIAGILWKRLEIDMPLQVDAAFNRVNGKNTYELTYADLAIDDPFNTYVNGGLPPEPITNPGLVSLEAAVTPTENDYLFYLSERDGTMHYAETHEEHVQNKAMYID